ncbi:IS5 family transposase [Pseudonocardia humida]|uniref:IS5 family transposase n=1 Tax=Pseudonocardia humida TaxID=2800819 RepID=A0ABT1ADJ2_9PSEU|nr:IS5 family transposase [Pseudonocardia humida]MCO1660993.1 IS5 family transposase [Pseudonocardia humida]
MVGGSTAQRLVTDELWEVVEPLIPQPRRPLRGARLGRPRVPDRVVLAGIVFVLSTGIRWNELPVELGCGSGTTCWRRLRDWQRAGVWHEVHRVVLDRLGQAGVLDWSRAAVDSVSVRAKRGGEVTGPSPTDRGKAGTKYHVLCDRNGLPLNVLITGANTHDSRMLAPLLDTNPGVREQVGRPGRPRRRPQKLHADKGDDFPRCRRYLSRRGIGVRIARRGIEDSSRLGRVRWVVERTMAWLLSFRRLALRHDRSRDTVEALLSLACALICLRRLPPSAP